MAMPLETTAAVAQKEHSGQDSAQKQSAFVGPLKGTTMTRENRDMSEGLEKSRSHKLGGLLQM